MADLVRALPGEVVGVVNTHEHFDHTFGNGVFRSAYGAIPIHAHETAAERTKAQDVDAKSAVRNARTVRLDGRVIFDYRMRPGVVTHSNALELMRAVGIEV